MIKVRGCDIELNYERRDKIKGRVTRMAKLFEIPDGTDIIELRKRINRISSSARETAKPDRCILCGRKQTSFCNSHSVPQLSLKNIAENGKLYLASALIGIEITDVEKGVNNSGTFHFICNKCDSKFFQEYENEQNLCAKPTDKMLAEIAVKNILLQLSKRNQEKDLYKILQNKFNTYSNPENLFGVNELDVRDFLDELKLHKDIVDNEKVGGYQILFWRVLPYTVPIASQSVIALGTDMEGNAINNVFDMSEHTRMQFMHLAILPLDGKSVVIAFYHKRDKLYKKLWHQFNSSSEDKCLRFLNYIVFANTENYFMSKSIKSEIENNEKLVLLSQENNGFPGMGLLSPHNLFGMNYHPITETDIPNFLAKEWGIYSGDL